MTLTELIQALQNNDQLVFQKPDKSFVPHHFHITEVGVIMRNFIDCGGTIRKDSKVNLQLWEADDFDHRLTPIKLLSIINLSIEQLSIDPSLEIEVEYQQSTIGKYGLAFDGRYFQLTNLATACLAEDSCGIPSQKEKFQLIDLGSTDGSCCTPGSSCC